MLHFAVTNSLSVLFFQSVSPLACSRSLQAKEAMQQRAEAFLFLPFPYDVPDSSTTGMNPDFAVPPTPVPAAAAPAPLALPSEHPTDEDLSYAAMLLNPEQEDVTLLEDGSVLHLADATGFSDSERTMSSTRQVCNAAGCTTLCRPRGRLCAKHQKQRERGRASFELKDPTLVLRKGRPPIPFSRSQKRKKLQRLDEFLNEFAGGVDEGTLLLKAYLESSFWEKRNGPPENSRIFEFVGRALLRELPPTHALRRQLPEIFSAEQIKEAMLTSEAARLSTTPIKVEQDIAAEVLL